jgi:hypothetical protein
MPFDTAIATPAMIAAGVPRSTKHIAAEAALASAKARRDEIGDEIRARGLAGSDDGPSLAELEAKKAAIDDGMQGVRAAALRHRAAHGEAVRKALKPSISAAASRGVDAVEALVEALQTLADCGWQITAAGGEAPFVPHIDLGGLAERLRRLAG